VTGVDQIGISCGVGEAFGEDRRDWCCQMKRRR